MKIEITKETAKAILLIEHRYYFELFEGISRNDEEEYSFRDAIIAIAKEIKEQETKQ